MQDNIDPAVEAEVRELARAGRLIEAIKRLREASSGMGLAEAKDAVERMADGMPASAPPPSATSEKVEDEVRQLLLQGKKIEAIRRLRAATSGMSLAEAKATIDRVAATIPGAPVEVRHGCLSIVGALVVLAGLAAWLARL